MNRKHIIRFIFIGIFTSFITISNAQDISFDQYYKAPTYLNPALTGVINGNYRISGIYHNQWQSQLDSDINAFFAGGDVKFEPNSSNGDIWGLGLTFLNDEYNTYNLSTKTMSINTSYHKLLDDKSKQYLGLGLQLSINQRNLDFENLSFEDQFNQLNGYSLPTGEFLPKNNYGYLDLGMGLYYSTFPSEDLFFNFGLSYFHINPTNISFYKETENPVASLEQESILNGKINIHTSASIGISEMIQFVPDLLFQKQGLHQNIYIGTRFRLNLNYEDPNNSLTLGLRAKLSKNIDNTSLSSIALLSEYKLKNLKMGFSYNVLLSPLVADQISFNTFEVSLTYMGVFNNDAYHCPEF